MSPESKKKLLWIIAGALIEGVVMTAFGWNMRGPDPLSDEMRMCSAVTDCIAAHPTKIDMTLSCGNALYKLKAEHDRSKAMQAAGK